MDQIYMGIVKDLESAFKFQRYQFCLFYAQLQIKELETVDQMIKANYIQIKKLSNNKLQLIINHLN